MQYFARDISAVVLAVASAVALTAVAGNPPAGVLAMMMAPPAAGILTMVALRLEYNPPGSQTVPLAKRWHLRQCRFRRLVPFRKLLAKVKKG